MHFYYLLFQGMAIWSTIHIFTTTTATTNCSSNNNQSQQQQQSTVDEFQEVNMEIQEAIWNFRKQN
jgi:hypothetical protein